MIQSSANNTHTPRRDYNERLTLLGLNELRLDQKAEIATGLYKNGDFEAASKAWQQVALERFGIGARSVEERWDLSKLSLEEREQVAALLAKCVVIPDPSPTSALDSNND